MNDDGIYWPSAIHPHDPAAARRVRGFMCKTDWDYEVGDASDGAKVYPSEAAVRRERKCTAQCGIVEVELKLVRVVQIENYEVGVKG